MKAPDVYSAAVTARVISRMLRKAGFKMADTSDRFQWTEGVHVHRVGVSSLVSVDYHCPENVLTPERKTFRKAEKDRALAFLVERGYALEDQTRWVRCKNP